MDRRYPTTSIDIYADDVVLDPIAACLPQYIHGRYELHAALVDAVADRDLRALDIIREHNTSGIVAHPVVTG